MDRNGPKASGEGEGSPLERDHRDIRAELDDHVERRARSLESRGLSPAEAKVEARRRLGDTMRLEQELLRIAERRSRRQLWKRRADGLVRDIRDALRGMRRRPLLAAGVVLTIGLAIGAASAVFAVVNGVLLRPLSYPSANALYSLYSRYLPTTGYDFEFFPLSGPEYDDYRAMTRAMSDVAVFGAGMTNLAGEDEAAERVPIAVGSANLLDVLGVAPALGRGFTRGEDAPGRACVALLSDGLWRERYSGDPGIVGGDIRLDGRPCEVIGVMPRGFWFPNERSRLWTTLELDRSSPFWERQSHPYRAVARLASGSTRAAAEAELEALRSQWSDEYPDHYARGHFLVLRPLLDDMVGDTRPALMTLLGAVGLVLLIVCVNLAGLLLSAAESRRNEFAVRIALGVGRARLVRQVLTESILLSLAGGVISLIVAGWLVGLILGLYPGGLPRGTEVTIDGVVLMFTLGVAVLAGLLFGGIPALQSTGVQVGEVLRASGRGLTAHRRRVEARRVFVAAQAALAVVLVVAASLLTQSYARLRAVDLGFDSTDALTFSVTVPSTRYREAARARDHFARLEERLAAIPGVIAAGALSDLPLRSSGGADDFIIEGKAVPAPGALQWNARYQMATPSALRALGLRLVKGRWFEPADGPEAVPVGVINEATARTYYAGEDPIGRRIRYYGDDAPWITIVGVVGDVRSLGATEEAPPAIFAALAQAPRPAYEGRSMNFVVRFNSAATAGAPALRAAVADVDPSLPPSELTTMERVVTESVGRPRFTVTLMSGFATIALLLGALGLYGVLAHSVQQRLHEIAIRMALGAHRAHVLGQVVAQGLLPVVIGTIIGLGAAVAFRSTLSSLLFGVSALDPVVLSLAAVTLLVVSLVACGLPGWRAMRTDPSAALRAE
jgi:putative ABC transport system permease protein